ncbi:MAG: dihydropteroate synthase [Calditrichaeota bacterium]|nr:dihydropteroate synthase [Calditrichota bacterium]
MGVLNVTPDSFSDGGKFFEPEAAYRRAMEMREQGAEWIDIGGESTRPGSDPVPLEEEWQRLAPVLNRLNKQEDIVISVDTYKSEIARRALEHGAHVVNDISGLTFDPQMREVVASHNVPVILMHIKGTPRDMQKNPTYTNLMDEVYAFLEQQVTDARSGGVHQIIVDPGIGFGKRWEDNYELIRRLEEFRGLGWPILIGPSRKSFIGRLLDLPPEQRVVGTMASVAAAYHRGARIFRVHDVEETRQTLQILEGVSHFKAM